MTLKFSLGESKSRNFPGASPKSHIEGACKQNWSQAKVNASTMPVIHNL